MGMDFIRKAAPRYRKSLDHRKVELATPDLFTQQPTTAPRAYSATLCSGQTLSAGEMVGVRMDGCQVVVMRGNDPVATFNSPPTELMDALLASHNEAFGRVQVFHAVAGTAEIVVC